MTIPNSAIKYGLGLTQINDSGTWKPVKSAWVMQPNGTWAPVKTGWISHDDGSWQRVYPTPKGIFTANVSTINHTYYQHYPDAGAALKVTNTGDFDLTINSISITDDVNFKTYANSLATFPITIAPNKSTNIPFVVGGNVIGTFSGTVAFTNYIGYLGYANTTINTSVTVLQDYNGIGVVGTVAPLIAYQGDDATQISYTSYTNDSFVVPFGVTSINMTIAGGGGAGGGGDTYAGGGGYPGHTAVGTYTVTPGDTISVYVGGGGGGGVSMAAGYGGGAGGTSGIGYGGGRGGNAGGAPASGAGGGGGAATVIKKNGTIIAVAAGGGGGGGGGDHGGPAGQNIEYTGGTAGTQGEDKGGDGGGAGGGGGGDQGGVGGSVTGFGDVGGYAGSDGADASSLPVTFGRASNGGGSGARPSSGGAGGDGYAYFSMSGIAVSAAQTITIQNIGNGIDLNISSVTSKNGHFAVYDLSATTLGFNFATYTGATAQFTIAPYSTLPLGTYPDAIIITSDAVNAPILEIPINVIVAVSTGSAAFTSPGRHYWTVPPHVHSIDVFAVAAGGSGGAGENASGGGGGGGGSGGYTTRRKVTVTPGETVTIDVGNGATTGTATSRSVFPVTDYDAWSSFMNSYAVWVSVDGFSPVGYNTTFTRTFNAPTTGNYTFEFSGDNYIEVYVDEVLVGTSSSFTSTSSVVKHLSQGNRVIKIVGLNQGGPAGLAVAIANPSNTIIWSTRDNMNSGSGQQGSTTTLSGSFGSITVTGGVGGAAATQSFYEPHDGVEGASWGAY